MSTTRTTFDGCIMPGAIYTRAAFLSSMGLGLSTVRKFRRAGIELKSLEIGQQILVRGADGIAWLVAIAAQQGTATNHEPEAVEATQADDFGHLPPRRIQRTTGGRTVTRLQRKRQRGYRLPADAVYVGRPTRWGNPFPVTIDSGRGEAVAKYREWIAEPAQERLRNAARQELQGKPLACWCPPGEPCHADVLLEIANATGGAQWY